MLLCSKLKGYLFLSSIIYFLTGNLMPTKMSVGIQYIDILWVIMPLPNPGFFKRAGTFFSLVWLPSSSNFQKFACSDLQKLPFWSISFARSMSSLPSFLLSSLLFSCFLYYIQYSPHSQGTKNLVFEFPG